ncbi:diguanylate cyclase/phosphodiesterase (GGDEF & EAL domains) with PAS/PAC sensor(s) [hydrothermal vent metagenome]|uniref:histidine kinase n=1 Tax=hydrothermal vent metagenome TaxID=652676 RepID=A0A3B1AZY9_9ZZZZ
METTKFNFNLFLYSRSFILLAVLMSLFVTIIVYLQLREQQQHSFDLRLDKTASNYTSVFSLKIISNINELRNLARFYNSKKFVTQNDFVRYVSPLFEQNNGIKALEWIPRVPQTDLKTHQQVLAKTYKNYRVWQRDSNGDNQTIKQQAFYYPVQYVYPYEGNEKALGYDLGSNKKRQAALLLAGDSGRAVATESIQLVQQKNINAMNQSAFLIFYPYYKLDNHTVRGRKISNWTTSQRQKNLKGFMLGVFKVGDMFEAAIKNLPSSGLDISIFDVSDKLSLNSEEFLYRHRSRLSDRNKKIANGNFAIENNIAVADRQWVLRFEPTVHYYNQFKHDNATIFLLVGLFMSMLLLLYLLILRYRINATNLSLKKHNARLINNEIKQRIVIETIADGVMVINDQGIVESFNPAAALLFGYDEAEVLGKNVKMFISEDISPKHDVHIQKFVSSDEKEIVGFSREVTGLHKNGGTFPLKLSVKEMLIEGDLKFTGVMHDITEQKDFETKMIIAKELAESGTKIKNDFLATMSHEIRTPMNGVLGMIQLLNETSLTNEQREYVDVIKNSGSALLEIINNILDFSKIEAGQLKIDIIEFNLEQIIFDVIQLLARNAQRKNIRFIFNYSVECPKYVLGDPNRLRQVIMNLVGNAVKFTEQGHIYILVKQIKKINSKCTMRIVVQDTGIGISEQALPQLFESFTQADSSISRQYGGTGLGLAISKQLVKLMGGDINVTSQVNAGSTFSINITLTDQDTSNVFDDELIEDIKVLIVDDYEFSRTQLATQLSGFGAKVSSVATGSAALEKLLKHNNYDVMVLDHSANRDLTFELIKDIRCYDSLLNVGIILLSSQIRIGDTEYYRAAGVNAYFNKPIMNSILIKALFEVAGNNKNGLITLNTLTLENNNKISNHSKITGSVLIVEDNDVNSQVIKALLNKMGIRCELVFDGEQAVNSCKENNFDLILMDCQMPVMDGYQATAEIRKNEQQNTNYTTAIPIIALTANVMQGDKEKCLAAGMDDFLAKPIDSDALEAMLKIWLTKNNEKIQLPIEAFKVDTTMDNNYQDTIDLEKIQQLQELMGEAMSELINSFVTSSSDVIHSIQHAKQVMDSAELYQLAHSLKGTSGNVGAVQLMGLSSKIEQLAKQGQLNDVDSIIEQLLMSFDETKKQLLSVINQ